MHALTAAEELNILYERAKEKATTAFDQMEDACNGANKQSEGYEKSISLQIQASTNYSNALKTTEKQDALTSFNSAREAAKSAMSFCIGTDKLPLSDENYDSAFTGNIIMRLGDGLLSGNESRLSQIFRGDMIKIINRVLGALAILYLLIIGMKYIFARGEDEDMSRYKIQFLWLTLGLVVISLAEFIGFEIFNPDGNDILAPTTTLKLSDKVQDIVRYVQYAVGAFVLIIAGITGYQFVIVGGGEEASSLEKKFFKSLLLGSTMILMSEVVVRILAFTDSPQKTTEILVSEVAGIVNFALTLVAIASMGMLALSSLYFVISLGEEDQTSKAKSMIKTSIMGIVIASASYVLVRFLIP